MWNENTHSLTRSLACLALFALMHKQLNWFESESAGAGARIEETIFVHRIISRMKINEQKRMKWGWNTFFVWGREKLKNIGLQYLFTGPRFTYSFCFRNSKKAFDVKSVQKHLTYARTHTRKGHLCVRRYACTHISRMVEWMALLFAADVSAATIVVAISDAVVYIDTRRAHSHS